MNDTLPTIETIEQALKHLPKVQMSKRVDALFQRKLRSLVDDAHYERGKFWTLLSRFAWTASFAVVATVFSSTVWAYQDTVTRGHFLYPWKQRVEKIERRLAFTPLQKIDTHVRFSDRRLSEARNIIDGSPDLTWLIQKAYAHAEDLHLETKAGQNLALTLDDFRFEMAQASRVIQESNLVTVQAASALQKVQDVTNRQVALLDTLSEKTAQPEVVTLMSSVAAQAEDRLANIIIAHEEVEEAVNDNEPLVQVRFEWERDAFELPHVENFPLRDARKQRAENEVSQALKLVEKLPVERREPLMQKIETAQEAIEEGQFGVGLGLSRSVQKRATALSPLPSTFRPPVVEKSKPEFLKGFGAIQPIMPSPGLIPAPSPSEKSEETFMEDEEAGDLPEEELKIEPEFVAPPQPLPPGTEATNEDIQAFPASELPAVNDSKENKSDSAKTAPQSQPPRIKPLEFKKINIP